MAQLAAATHRAGGGRVCRFAACVGAWKGRRGGLLLMVARHVRVARCVPCRPLRDCPAQAAAQLQALHRGNAGRRVFQERQDAVIDGHAAQIQALYRGGRDRAKLEEHRGAARAASTMRMALRLQAILRGRVARRHARERAEELSHHKKIRGVRFRVCRTAQLRAGFGLHSAKSGVLRKGQVVQCLEQRPTTDGVMRVRFTDGWVSAQTRAGAPIPSSPPGTERWSLAGRVRVSMGFQQHRHLESGGAFKTPATPRRSMLQQVGTATCSHSAGIERPWSGPAHPLARRPEITNPGYELAYSARDKP